jgi:hypothetical protein
MIGLCDDIVMDDFNPETNAVLMQLNRSISRQDDCETRARQPEPWLAEIGALTNCISTS